ncbi:MAG: tRNA epoxyqueuosine(34) reductase QueG [Planctomycetes bacterium]|nr:tRNA epoxyqueuosine(34) reductase QueG [Planctomycetota bacterium]
MLPIETRLKEQARALGFDLVGIAPAANADGFAHLRDWLDQGFAGEMDYMVRHAEARRHPKSILPDVRTVVMVGINYKNQGSGVRDQESGGERQVPAVGNAPGFEGRVSSYAAGRDYHDVVREKLKKLLEWVQREVPGARGRGVVDTTPLLERDFARRAGLGWFGKNTMLLNKRLGSFFFLGALLLDLELSSDDPFEASHCGTCTRCLDACPTDAFAGPFQLDSRRCISYLTIELRGPIPDELRPAIGEWAFGCDICQDVCPWNRKAPFGRDPELQPTDGTLHLQLLEILELSDEEFRRRFGGTALWRTRRAGLLRNAAIVLGNVADERALPALERALNDVPLVREAAQWAIAQIRARSRAK